MRYLTKYWYNKMQKGVMNLTQEENEWFDLIDRLYLEETESFAYPLHDGVLINFQKINNNYELVVYVDIDDENIKTKFVKITFTNAAILEFEDNITFLKDKRQVALLEGNWNKLKSMAIYLNHELYKINNGYEFHLMVSEVGKKGAWTLKYISILCDNIDVQLSYEY